MHARYRAPTGNGDVLAIPNFDAVPRLIEANRRLLDRDDVKVGGLSLRELRSLARREVLDLILPSPLAGEGGRRPGEGLALPPSVEVAQREEAPTPLPAASRRPSPARGEGKTDIPLLLAGHQPELSHPGVWVKNFALAGLARKVGGIGLNLVVDNDTLKSTSLQVPVFREGDPTSYHLEKVHFDQFDGPVPYEDRLIHDTRLFSSFPARVAKLTANWDFKPLLQTVWDSKGNEPLGERVLQSGGTKPPGESLAATFTTFRKDREHAWGCENRELSVSRLSQTEAFRRFAGHILADLPRFREVYNAAIRDYRLANRVRSRNHPAPELGTNDIPFWVFANGQRRGSGAMPFEMKNLRPRALTLTMFARVCLGDFFIHGIGGGKYDEVTDAIIRNYFGIEPPAYQVLSATLHLPLPAFDADDETVTQAEQRLRDVVWNPQRHIPPDDATKPDTRELIEEKAFLASHEPPHSDHEARREWYRQLQTVTTLLRHLVENQETRSKAELIRARLLANANAVIRRRDFAWVLYPEHTLRPFLQRFL